ncbi:Wiskott-Aldrich syndrome protein family member 2, partial [Dissostichus eleginoides]
MMGKEEEWEGVKEMEDVEEELGTESSVDMCFCQPGSSGCCLFFPTLSIRECR